MVSGELLSGTKYQMDAGAGRDDRLWFVADAGDETVGSVGTALESADRDRLLGRRVWLWRVMPRSVRIAQHRHSDADSDVAAPPTEFLGDSSDRVGRQCRGICRVVCAWRADRLADARCDADHVCVAADLLAVPAWFSADIGRELRGAGSGRRCVVADVRRRHANCWVGVVGDLRDRHGEDCATSLLAGRRASAAARLRLLADHSVGDTVPEVVRALLLGADGSALDRIGLRVDCCAGALHDRCGGEGLSATDRRSGSSAAVEHRVAAVHRLGVVLRWNGLVRHRISVLVGVGSGGGVGGGDDVDGRATHRSSSLRLGWADRRGNRVSIGAGVLPRNRQVAGQLRRHRRS